MSKHFYYLLFGVIFFATTAGAQESGGATINGTVTDPDPSGTDCRCQDYGNPDRNRRRPQYADFERRPLKPLRTSRRVYDVTVEAAGFKQSKFVAVAVSVGAVVTLDARLAVGAAQEVVDVTAEALVVDTLPDFDRCESASPFRTCPSTGAISSILLC